MRPPRQPAGGVDDHDIAPPRTPRLNSLQHVLGSARGAAHEGAPARRPRSRLLLGGGGNVSAAPMRTERPCSRELAGELADSGRLTGPVDADDEDDGRLRTPAPEPAVRRRALHLSASASTTSGRSPRASSRRTSSAVAGTLTSARSRPPRAAPRPPRPTRRTRHRARPRAPDGFSPGSPAAARGPLRSALLLAARPVLGVAEQLCPRPRHCPNASVRRRLVAKREPAEADPRRLIRPSAGHAP